MLSVEVKKTLFFLFKNRGKGIWPSQKPFWLPPPRQKILETSLWGTRHDPATGTQYHIAPNRKLWQQPYMASSISICCKYMIILQKRGSQMHLKMDSLTIGTIYSENMSTIVLDKEESKVPARKTAM